MDELCFRGKDRFRSNKVVRIVPVSTVLLAAIVAGLTGGFAAAGSLVAVCVAVGVPAFVLSWRCWTRVGPSGIATFWGGSRGRTWTWDRISWIEVRSVGLPGSATYAVRFTLTDGRAKNLPGLGTSPLYPDPEFADKVGRLITCWELHTDPSSRTPPQARPSGLRTTGGVLLTLFTVGCLAGAIAVAAQLPSAYAARQAQRALPICTGEQLTHVGVQDCSDPLAMTVRAVSISSNTDVDSEVDLLDINAGIWKIDFASDLNVLRSLQPGDQVTADTATDGSTVTDLRFQGLVAHTVDSPEYRPATFTAGLVALVFGTVVGLGWILTRRRSPYHLVSWWGPCSLPALITLAVVSIQQSTRPGPLSADGFVLAGVLLIAGQLSAALIHRARRTRLARRRKPALA